jgi:hypothetical protein
LFDIKNNIPGFHGAKGSFRDDAVLGPSCLIEKGLRLYRNANDHGISYQHRSFLKTEFAETADAKDAVYARHSDWRR